MKSETEPKDKEGQPIRKGNLVRCTNRSIRPAVGTVKEILGVSVLFTNADETETGVVAATELIVLSRA